MFGWIKNLFTKDKKSVNKRPLNDEQFKDLKIAREKKLNQILEKISKSGYESLNQNEKNFLKNIGEF